MSAENVKKYTVTVKTSERDSDSGITVNAAYRRFAFTEDELEAMADVNGLLWVNGINIVNDDESLKKGAVLKDNASGQAAAAGVEYVISIPDKGLVAAGSFDEISTVAIPSTSNITVEICLFVDQRHYDTMSDVVSADGYDDRDQVSYKVYLQSAIGSDYHEYPVTSYWVNKTDDFQKLLANGDYSGLEGWNVPAYDAEYNEYYYQYEIKDGAIYGTYEKADGSAFKKATQPENTLDKDGDGIVTCDEYYGVTGLKWDDKKNACVTTSGNAVVTVPDTSAR